MSSQTAVSQLAAHESAEQHTQLAYYDARVVRSRLLCPRRTRVSSIVLCRTHPQLYEQDSRGTSGDFDEIDDDRRTKTVSYPRTQAQMLRSQSLCYVTLGDLASAKRAVSASRRCFHRQRCTVSTVPRPSVPQPRWWLQHGALDATMPPQQTFRRGFSSVKHVDIVVCARNQSSQSGQRSIRDDV